MRHIRRCNSVASEAAIPVLVQKMRLSITSLGRNRAGLVRADLTSSHQNRFSLTTAHRSLQPQSFGTLIEAHAQPRSRYAMYQSTYILSRILAYLNALLAAAFELRPAIANLVWVFWPAALSAGFSADSVGVELVCRSDILGGETFHVKGRWYKKLEWSFFRIKAWPCAVFCCS